MKLCEDRRGVYASLLRSVHEPEALRPGSSVDSHEGGSLRKPKDASAGPGALVLRLFAEAERGRTPVNTHPLTA